MSKQTSASPDVLVQDADYDIPIEKVERVFERFPLELAGKSVLVKPNLLGKFAPEKAVTTHPSLVRAVVACVRARGGNVIVGDNPGLRCYGANEKAGESTGVAEASDGAFQNIAAGTRTVRLDGSSAGEVVISSAVLDSDVVISLPKMKTHMLTQMTCAIKNTYGYLSGGEKIRLHSLSKGCREFSELVLDIYQVRPPDLTIVDAVVAMEGDGPSAGEPRAVGKLIAGRDAVLVDLLATKIMRVDPMNIDQLRIARERGLLDKDIETLALEGDLGNGAPFRMPSNFKSKLGFGAFNFVGSVFRRGTRLAVIEGRCVKCKLCVDQCPVDAITMTDYPRFDDKKCIQCYCCHEICPESAIHEVGFIPRLRAMLSRS